MRRSNAFLLWLASLLPYVLVAGAWAKVANGREQGFWFALGALLAARLFFAGIEWFGGIVIWRVYGRRRMIEWLVAAIQHPKVQPNEMARDDAIFRFEALPAHMQLEMLRWIVNEGLAPDMRTEDVIGAAAARCWPPKLAEVPAP